MEFPVYHGGIPVGTVTTQKNNHKIEFQVCCSLTTTEILRCFGIQRDQKLVRIGVLEPTQEGLTLNRSLSLQEIGQDIPQEYILAADETQAAQIVRTEHVQPDIPQAASPPILPSPPIFTGDVLLDAVVENGSVKAQQQGKQVCLSCPFTSQQPFALAFAAVQCQIEKKENDFFAVLWI